MNSMQIRDVLDRLEFMRSEMSRMHSELGEYHSNMKNTIDRLEAEGLPQEFVSRFREDHIDKLSRYFDGLSEHIERESIPYTQKVIEKTNELLSSIG